MRNEQVRVTEEYKLRINGNMERREKLVKDFIDKVVNPLLVEDDLTAATCSLTSKKHKSARDKIGHLTFFLRPTQDQASKLKKGEELLDLVAFETPSLDTFNDINEELGSSYDVYSQKM